MQFGMKRLGAVVLSLLLFSSCSPARPTPHALSSSLEERFELTDLSPGHLAIIDATLGNLKEGDRLWGARIQTIGKSGTADVFTLEKTGSVLEITLDQISRKAGYRIKAADLADLDRLKKAGKQILGVIPEKSWSAELLRRLRRDLGGNLRLFQSGDDKAQTDQYIEPQADPMYAGIEPNSVLIWFIDL